MAKEEWRFNRRSGLARRICLRVYGDAKHEQDSAVLWEIIDQETRALVNALREANKIVLRYRCARRPMDLTAQVDVLAHLQRGIAKWKKRP